MKETVSMERVKLETIESLSNRKYTKDEDWDQFLNSVKEHGIIQAPVLRVAEVSKTGKESYRVIAGRRRIEAARQLKSKEVLCVIYGEGDPRSDDEIALAENVNRQAMHPLDEAALFFKMECKGLPPKEIAKLYARSPQDIYKRLRLMRLTDDLKNFYKDGKMDIAAAAIIAELPEEDQKEFYEEHEDEIFEDGDDVIKGDTAARYVQSTQKYKIKPLMTGCGNCKTRTHNRGNDLFEEFGLYDDACLDADCYRGKFYDMIDAALGERIKAEGTAADNKIYFASGFPAELYKKATYANFSGVKYDVLKSSKYVFSHGETKRKNGACWRIGERGDGQITVERVEYKEKPKAERAEKTAGKAETKKKTDYVDRYGREIMEAVAADAGKTAAEIAGSLEKKDGYWKYNRNIEELLLSRITGKRIELDKTGRFDVNYFSIFMRMMDNEVCGKWLDEYLNAEDKKILEDVTGKKSLAELAAGIPDSMQPVFHFFLLSMGLDYDIPSLDDLEKLKPGDNIFFDYGGLPKEEYRALYIEAGKEAAGKLLGKGKKKAELKKKEKPEVPAKEGGVQKCRVCGCTEDDCTQCIEKTGEPCYWVEDDLCSACAEDGDDLADENGGEDGEDGDPEM